MRSEFAGISDKLSVIWRQLSAKRDHGAVAIPDSTDYEIAEVLRAIIDLSADVVRELRGMLPNESLSALSWFCDRSPNLAVGLDDIQWLKYGVYAALLSRFRDDYRDDMYLPELYWHCCQRLGYDASGLFQSIVDLDVPVASRFFSSNQKQSTPLWAYHWIEVDGTDGIFYRRMIDAEVVEHTRKLNEYWANSSYDSPLPSDL